MGVSSMVAAAACVCVPVCVCMCYGPCNNVADDEESIEHHRRNTENPRASDNSAHTQILDTHALHYIYTHKQHRDNHNVVKTRPESPSSSRRSSIHKTPSTR